MSSNSALVVSSLDFDTIKNNLKTFLKSQNQFADYDFDGSNLSVLIDLLSYNTYMNNFYTNMAISESFLDSAQIIDSVVSRAKELNYTPRSYASAVAYIDFTIQANDSPSVIVVPKGTAFNARLDNNIYTFTTDQSVLVYDHGGYSAANVAIYEGVYVTESFTVDSSVAQPHYVLNNPQIDTSSLSVTIQNSQSDTTSVNFTQATSMLGYNSTSTIYFVQATNNGKYELVFGDGNVGQALLNGNIIQATYRVASGSDATKATNFSPASSIAGYSTVTVTSNTAAFGGANSESISSIKYNAPRHYQTQDRAITPEDYKTILKAHYPDIRALNVYGGEKIYPPQFGKVFISIDFNSFVGIPNIVAADVVSFIKTKMPIEMNPIVVSPDYLYISTVTTAEYNVNISALNPSDIKAEIISAINGYNDASLNNFDITFRHSKLAATIDNADTSIVSSNLTSNMIKRLVPPLNTAEIYTINYNNSIVPKTLYSTILTYNNVPVIIQDQNGLGFLDLTTTSSGGLITTVLSAIGTIDYTTGTINILLPSLSNYEGNYINLYAQPTTLDFSAINNTVLLIDPADIDVSVTAVRA